MFIYIEFNLKSFSISAVKVDLRESIYQSCGISSGVSIWMVVVMVESHTVHNKQNSKLTKSVFEKNYENFMAEEDVKTVTVVHSVLTWKSEDASRHE